MGSLDIARRRAAVAVRRAAGRGSARPLWQRRVEVVRRRGIVAALGAAVLAAAGMVTVGAAPAVAQAGPGNEVLSWGVNSVGQLGDGSGISRDTPGSVLLPAGATFVKVAAGRTSGHSLALTSSGLVYAWGQNDRGQLGDGTNTNRDLPVQVEGLPGDTTVVDIAAGGRPNAAGRWRSP